MVDTHCHLFSEYYDDLDAIISKIKKSGIRAIIINGCDMKSNKEVIELTKKYDIVYGALGFHPTELDNITDEDFIWLEENINNKKIVAIGEIGLDYHYPDTNKKLQKEIFNRQLKLAEKYNKPIIIHTRDSIQDTYDILRQYKLTGSIHCYSGSVDMAKKFINLGFCLGIGGIVTFKNARNIIEVIRDIDLEYLLLETDSPYLTPEPFRKNKNDSSYLAYILNKISEVKGIDADVVASCIDENTIRVFDI